LPIFNGISFNDFPDFRRMKRHYFKYLTPGANEEKWGLYVTSAGYAKSRPNDLYPAGKHPPSHQLTWNKGRILNDYYVVFIAKGRGTYSSSLNKPVEVNGGMCFFLYPGVWHRYKPEPKTGWEEYWVGFNGFYAQHLMTNVFGDHNNCIYEPGPDRNMLLLFQQLMDIVRASLSGYPQQIAGLTIQLLGHINNLGKHAAYKDDRIGKLIAKAQFIMQESFEEPLNMEVLARELPMGYSSFRKEFKRITDESPNQYLLNLRLERARYLLSTTALNISEIADQTGFRSVFHFSKLFKKKHGLSPGIFREGH
jgi:AraC-like DNA-binding protein